MGLFSSSKAISTKRSEYVTTTNTNIRDIGLSGQHAVDLAAILSTGAIEQQRLGAVAVDKIVQTAGNSAQQLVGGASNLITDKLDESPIETYFPWLVIAGIVIIPLLLK